MVFSDDSPAITANAKAAAEVTDAVKKVMKNLLLTRKFISLYPEGHIVIINAIEDLSKLLGKFIIRHGDLRLEVERDYLIFNGEIIYSAPAEEGSLPFALFRDGIRWIEFNDGIEPFELTAFLKIINTYSILSDEPEGDIVTAFWETRLPHIKYEVVEFFWDVDDGGQTIQLSESGTNDMPIQRHSKVIDWETIPNPPIDINVIVITPTDKEKLLEMIRIEESFDPAGYVNALFDSLLQHQEQDNYKTILEVFEEEFRASLKRMDFNMTLKIIQNLGYVKDTCRERIPWVIPLIDDFMLSISSSVSLKPLQDVWPGIGPEKYDALKQTLTALHPEAITSLAPILIQNQASALKQILSEMIMYLDSRDSEPLDNILKTSDDQLMEGLVPIIVSLEGARAADILIQLTRHSTSSVRVGAIKELLRRKTPRIMDLYSLIDDPDRSVRLLVLRQITQSRDSGAERFLLKYLNSPKSGEDDLKHVVACITALGYCGTSDSIPFLEQKLFEKAWMPGSRTSDYRDAAALALSRMKIPEARSILEKASKSLIPSVRQSSRRVMLQRKP